MYHQLLCGMLSGLISQGPEENTLSGQKQFLPAKPNILCIVCEDISPFLGCYGDPVAKTPTLDRLAMEGIRYTQMHTPVGVSAPSRAALITGMYPTAIGANNMRNTGEGKYMPAGVHPYNVVLSEGVKCYTEYLRAAGYYCTNNSKTDYQFEAPLTAWDENSAKAHRKNRPAGMPFFSIINLGSTHESQVWARADHPLRVDPAKVPLPPYYPDDSIVRRDVARMYSNISEMDDEVQSILDELKAAGEIENTIIIWYSDNGGPLPRGKREIYETGTRVPMIVRFPDGRMAGTLDENLHSFVDIPATVLSLAGIHTPAYMHGQAFLGAFETAPRKYVFGGRNRMDEIVDKAGYVRDKRFRYVRNYFPGTADYMDVQYRKQMPLMQRLLELYQAGKLDSIQRRWFDYPRPAEELFDVLADPFELHNLAGNPEFANDIQRLSKAYDDWDKKYNALWKMPETELQEYFMPQGMQPQTGNPLIRFRGDLLEISVSTPGTSVAYQVNGKGYAEDHWLLFTHPVRIKIGDKVRAVAVRAGYRNSMEVVAEAE
ncbi:MAG: sulfatase [Bacteroidales bacterium]